MENSREAVIAAMESALLAMKALRGQLRVTESTYRECMDGLVRGLPIEASLEAIGASGSRLTLNDRLHELEQQRHQARLSVIATGLAEGMSIGQVGRYLGFSRQMAARYAKEARAPTSQADGGGASSSDPTRPTADPTTGSGSESP